MKDMSLSPRDINAADFGLDGTDETDCTPAIMPRSNMQRPLVPWALVSWCSLASTTLPGHLLSRRLWSYASKMAHGCTGIRAARRSRWCALVAGVALAAELGGWLS